jgi:hypothetical protein
MSQPVSGYLYDRNLIRIKASTTVSATADTTGVDVSQFKGNGVTFIFDCSAVAGAGSLAIKIQECATSGGTYTDVAGVPTITVAASGVTTLFVPGIALKFVCLDQTLTGTSVTYSCIAYGQPGDATVSQGYTIAPQV